MQSSSSRNVVFVLSLGQIAGADISASIGAFAGLWSDKAGDFKSIAHPFCWLGSAVVYGYDSVIGGKIDNFKAGHSLKEEFRAWMKTMYGQSDEKIDEAWNALCVVTAENKANVQSLCQALARHPNAYVLVVSVTNSINADYIKSNLFKDCDLSRIRFAFSFEQHNLSLVTLASTALKTYYDGYMVVSLHRDIADSATIGVDQQCFIKHRSYDPRTGEKLGDVIEEVMGK